MPQRGSVQTPKVPDNTASKVAKTNKATKTKHSNDASERSARALLQDRVIRAEVEAEAAIAGQKELQDAIKYHGNWMMRKAYGAARKGNEELAMAYYECAENLGEVTERQLSKLFALLDEFVPELEAANESGTNKKRLKNS